MMAVIGFWKSNDKTAVDARGMGGKEKTMVVNCSFEDFERGVQAYQKGALVQDAFHFLSRSEREFLISGMTPQEWYNIFGPNDE